MTTHDLSILIPSRNEMFLGRTIEDILANIEGNTEIIVVLDGYKPEPPLKPDPRITLIYHPESIGQRAATNEAAKLSKAKYLMKCDAHCAFDKGFDIKMISDMQPDWTMVPIMRNLHAFDWVCEAGHRRYQGPSGPCKECGKETKRDVVWIAKTNPQSKSYCFDSTPHFQYFGEYTKRPEGQGDITETMSLQGSCWMLTRDKYWELNVCDENFGSWGSQGIEVAVKTWLSGGRVMVNKKTWYAHMFRTQGGDFGFPYPISGKQQEHAKTFARDLFFNNKWDKQVHPMSWLIEKFWPVKGWTEEDLAKLKANTFTFSGKSLETKPAESEPTPDGPTKGIIYYTDNQLDEKIAKPVRDQLLKVSLEKNIPIVSATLKKIDFGVKNIHFPSLRRGYPALFKQIMSALEHSSAEIIFFCEHDVLYSPSHFDFVPQDKDTFYYNQNVWLLRTSDGHALHYDVNQLSGLCGYRKELLTHFKI
ncbi:MAG: glycosyltransferase family 2 protein [Candidatus Levybacteria bacterium]|nr:glycosyltransferase family 2 protein [Candidatus Levybacteria bacterium]